MLVHPLKSPISKPIISPLYQDEKISLPSGDYIVCIENAGTVYGYIRDQFGSMTPDETAAGTLIDQFTIDTDDVARMQFQGGVQQPGLDHFWIESIDAGAVNLLLEWDVVLGEYNGYQAGLWDSVSAAVGTCVDVVIVAIPDLHTVLNSIYPDPDTGEILEMPIGIGSMGIDRASVQYVYSDEKKIWEPVPAGVPAFVGRSAFDPDQQVIEWTASATTPDPVRLRIDTFNSTTWSVDIEGTTYHKVPPSIYQYMPVTAGDSIDMYIGEDTDLRAIYIMNQYLLGDISLFDLTKYTAMDTLYISHNQLTGSIPDFSANTALTTVYLNNNQLTGSIPDFSANTALAAVYLSHNQLTGSIPDLSANTAQAHFQVSYNQLTGLIPDFSANTRLLTTYLDSNQLTDYAGGATFAFTGAINFRADNNALTETAVNNLLIDFDNGGTPAGTLNLGSGTNAAPTGAGLLAVDSLRGKGWTVTVNT